MVVKDVYCDGCLVGCAGCLVGKKKLDNNYYILAKHCIGFYLKLE